MDEKDLYEETLRLLDSSGKSLRIIAEGSGVNYHWLGKFKQRKFDNPGVKTIQRLRRYLLSLGVAA
jgi:hypothetical protein